MGRRKSPEVRISLDELAQMVDVSLSTIRVWMNSYKFARYTKYDNSINNTKQLNVTINEKFCKSFIPFLALKGLNRKNYVKNFCDGMDKLNCKY